MSPGHDTRATLRRISLDEVAPIFFALGDATRLGLVARLCNEGPLSSSRLSDGAEITRQAITKHLDALAVAGLVTDSRRGRERIWQLTPGRIDEARRCLDQISAHWDIALGRLKDLVERTP